MGPQITRQDKTTFADTCTNIPVPMETGTLVHVSVSGGRKFEVEKKIKRKTKQKKQKIR